MPPIEILPDVTTEEPSYRAICGGYQAIGPTPGQALDTLEAQLTAASANDFSETLVIVRRFGPDDLFTAEQRSRLRELMDQHHAAIAQGISIAQDLQVELEKLVEAEMEANIQRSQRLLQQTGHNIARG